MSEHTIALASETDKTAFTHCPTDHAGPGRGAAQIRARVAAFDRLVAEPLKER